MSIASNSQIVILFLLLIVLNLLEHISFNDITEISYNISLKEKKKEKTFTRHLHI